MDNFKGQPIETDGIISAKTSKLIIPKCLLALTSTVYYETFHVKTVVVFKTVLGGVPTF